MIRAIFKRYLISFFLLYLILLGTGLFINSPVNAQNTSVPENIIEHLTLDERSDGFFFMKDLESENIIMKTARFIRPGDQYINSENKLYFVEKVTEEIAWARCKGKIKLYAGNPSAVLKSKSIDPEGNILQGNQGDTIVPRIGVYHSHGAESYVPSDGEESTLEGGGILQVGRSFVETLREKGFKVNYSAQTHVPHDAGAYNRSRRTAEQFLHQGVGALFDVHRDAVPAEEYIAEVENEPTVQVQIVVGQENQNAQTNRNFAESLKNVADSIHPGLIKGIFMASGNYNQDILPLSLLFEVGSHENTREGAAKSMTLFGDVIQVYFMGEPGKDLREGMGSVVLKSILWVVFVAGLVMGGYLLIGTGNLEELRAKLRHFFSREFAEFKGKRNDGESDGDHGGDGGTA